MEEDAGNPCLPSLDSVVACHQEVEGRRRIFHRFRGEQVAQTLRRFQEEEEPETLRLQAGEAQSRRRFREAAVEQSHLRREGLAEAVP